MNETPKAPPALILASAVRRRMGGVSDTTLYRIERRDPTFPRPVFLSARLKGYPADQFDTWLRTQMAGAGLRTRTK